MDHFCRVTSHTKREKAQFEEIEQGEDQIDRADMLELLDQRSKQPWLMYQGKVDNIKEQVIQAERQKIPKLKCKEQKIVKKTSQNI